MSYQVLARKWRPRSFSEMVGQEHVLKALINALDHNRLHHAYLFTGTRGVGKTTVARILAKCLNCETGIGSSPCGVCNTCVGINEGRFVDVIEVDAASRTKVEDTRELLDNVQYSPTSGRYKIYLIDEVHMLSNSSFNALLKTLEEPPEHVKFLLATTDPQKLPATILSRCLQFNLKNMSAEKIVAHLETILAEEMVPFDASALWQLARAADGSMRDALSLTDQAIAFGNGKLDETDVTSMLGTIDHKFIQNIVDALVSLDGQKLLNAVAKFSEHAPDYSAALADLQTLLHRIAIAQALPEALDNSYGDREQILSFATQLTSEDVQLFYQTALMGQRDLSLCSVPRTGFEMTLLRMLAFKPQALIDVPKNAFPVPASEAIAASSSATEQPKVADSPEQASTPPESHQVSGEMNAIERASSEETPPWREPSKEDLGHNAVGAEGNDPVKKLEAGVDVAEAADDYLPHAERKVHDNSTSVQTPVESTQLDAVPEEKITEVLRSVESSSTDSVSGGVQATELLSEHEEYQAIPASPQNVAPPEAIKQEPELHASALQDIPHAPSKTAAQLRADIAEIEQRNVSSSGTANSIAANSITESTAESSNTAKPPQGSAANARSSGLEREPIAFDKFEPKLWTSLFFQLPITGVVRMTASNLVCVGRQENLFFFVQDERSGGLLSNEHAQVIGDALNDYFGVPCRAEISVGATESDTETPAQYRERRRAEQRADAINDLKADPVVQSLQEQFGATLDEDSVKVVEEEL